MLEIQHLSKTFNPGEISEKILFTDFSYSVTDGDFVSVVGSNGSGKTSILNLLCGSVQPDGGKILLDGKDLTRLPEYRRYALIGRVYQNPALGSCAHLTVAENLALAENKGKRFSLTPALSKRKTEQYDELLKQINLEGRLQSKVGTLSGGQRQALSLLMATMTPIRFLILDEHTAALDPKASEAVMELTDRIVKEKNLTAIMVTHNLRFAVEYGNRLLMLNRGEIVKECDREEKKTVTVDDLLGIFNTISIECGN